MLFLNVQVIFAQSVNCEEIQKENDYLKKALHILNPVKTVTAKNIGFNISKCEGNAKEQSIYLTLVLTNHGPNTDLGLRKAIAVDAEGNEYETYQINIGSGSSNNKVYTDVPVKTIFKFEKVLPTVKLLKLIAIEFTGNNCGFEYKDIPVTWK
jgi:hypothetical protein